MKRSLDASDMASDAIEPAAKRMALAPEETQPPRSWLMVCMTTHCADRMDVNWCPYRVYTYDEGSAKPELGVEAQWLEWIRQYREEEKFFPFARILGFLADDPDADVPPKVIPEAWRMAERRDLGRWRWRREISTAGFGLGPAAPLAVNTGMFFPIVYDARDEADIKPQPVALPKKRRAGWKR